jgi:hypothetical protein
MIALRALVATACRFEAAEASQDHRPPLDETESTPYSASEFAAEFKAIGAKYSLHTRQDTDVKLVV